MNNLGSLRREYPHRIERARSLMHAQELDALLLFTGPNLVYFTGMPCSRSGSRPFVYLLPRQGEPVLIVHAGRRDEARRFTDVGDVRTYTRLSHLPLETVLSAIEGLGLQKGCIGAELGGEMVLDLPFADFVALQDALPDACFVDGSPLLWQLRMIKSEAEIARVARACEITSQAYAQTYTSLRAGLSEAEIQNLMFSNMMALGGSSPWGFITSGTGNYDMVSKGPSSRCVEPGDMVWMDGGCTVDGYWSDFDRSAVVGGASSAQKAVQREVHEITHQGVAMMRPGVPVAEIAAHCNEAIRALKFPVTSDISGRAARVGHGLGMVVTELPSLSEEDPTVLEAGMIVTIEPGVATDDGTFHMEENVLITADGPQVLTTAQWELWTI
ncbi:MAG: Xaa-Pro peptidase family protein [Candidatus Poribacteria bacterium]|nr:Xaa-Pro peptidase family protein [Candidatus Poribacteria bacterium]